MADCNQLQPSWDCPEVDGPSSEDQCRWAFEEFLRRTADKFNRHRVNHRLGVHPHEWEIWRAAWTAARRFK